MELKNCKLIKVGGSYGILIPCAIINKGLLSKGKSYDIIIGE